jgi:RNA polymerase sigma factor (sigma-70 family)
MTEQSSTSQFSDMVGRIVESGDRQAFAGLFEHFAPRIKSWLMAAGCCPESTAEELVQESMLALWHQAGSYRRDRAAVSTWVFTIARNKRIDRLRRERRPTPLMEEQSAKPADTSRDYGWDVIAGEQRRLEQSIDELPSEQQDVLHKFYVEDKSHSLIAQELDLAVGTVKSRLRLALTRLRTVWT